MSIIRKGLLIAALIITTGAFRSNAQIYVRIRPARPHFERVVAPSPRHVWIDEEWEPRGGTYIWAGGHWAEPPYERAVWVPGHWRQRHDGWIWIRGHWRR